MFDLFLVKEDIKKMKKMLIKALDILMFGFLIGTITAFAIYRIGLIFIWITLNFGILGLTSVIIGLLMSVYAILASIGSEIKRYDL